MDDDDDYDDSMRAAVVRWDNMNSSVVVQLQCGVRQGGVLSPMLFAVYVNDRTLALSKFSHGFYFDNMFANFAVCLM